jgi:TRAP-type mannitol/chloroaromatic compound transport system substrate-binding protein
MWSEAELNFDANVEFADSVREMSNGRVDIEAFSSGALMPYTEYFDAVRGGVVELSQTGGTYWVGKDTALAAIDMASLFIGDYPRTVATSWRRKSTPNGI